MTEERMITVGMALTVLAIVLFIVGGVSGILEATIIGVVALGLAFIIYGVMNWKY